MDIVIEKFKNFDFLRCNALELKAENLCTANVNSKITDKLRYSSVISK